MRPDQRHRLLWTGAIVLLIARPVLTVAAQGLVATIYAAQGGRSIRGSAVSRG